MTGVTIERTGDSQWRVKYSDSPEDLIHKFWMTITPDPNEDGNDDEDLAVELR